MTIQQAINNFNKLINTSIIKGGNEAKTSMIRSSLPILNLHEAVKYSLISNDVAPENIYPPLNARTPELKLAGALKQKDQDVCITPNDVEQVEEILVNGLLQGTVDKYGERYTEQTLVINIRSQISSIQKNFDTLYERTVSPKMLEKYIKSFTAINLRSNTQKDFYKYEQTCLLIVDFSKKTPKIYNSTKELIKHNFLPKKTTVSIENLSFDNFVSSLISTYETRFGTGKLS